MNEKTTELLSKYELKVGRVTRARGGFLCDTENGLKLFREYKGTEKHLEIESFILDRIKESGRCRADYIVKNSEGEMLTKDDDGMSYILKDWYTSHECNVWDKSEICNACGMLARIHLILSGYNKDRMFDLYPCNLMKEYERHNNEMRRARSFIRNKNRKNEFELKILSCFDRFYIKAADAGRELEKCNYEAQRENAYDNQTICHGSFNYHNILFYDKEAIPVNFERAVVDIQITDFYDFLRKVMEKYNWDAELGYKMLNEYDRVRTISRDERKLIYVMLLYPEKFWKIVNQYYNGNKSWIPDKNADKLNTVCSQDEKKQQFVNTVNP